MTPPPSMVKDHTFALFNFGTLPLVIIDSVLFPFLLYDCFYIGLQNIVLALEEKVRLELLPPESNRIIDQVDQPPHLSIQGHHSLSSGHMDWKGGSPSSHHWGAISSVSCSSPSHSQPWVFTTTSYS